MTGQHRGLRMTRRQRRMHQARALSEVLTDAMDMYFWYFCDAELLAISQVRAGLHRIADEQEAVRHGR